MISSSVDDHQQSIVSCFSPKGSRQGFTDDNSPNKNSTMIEQELKAIEKIKNK
jgi:hypothetical protein